MSDAEEQTKDEGFKVNDKRRFESDGSSRADQDNEEQRRFAEPQADACKGIPLPEIDFATFILSLGTSAMVHLGEGPDPEGAGQKNLNLAKQTIDIICLLKQKTQGNLDQQEQKLIDELLYDLRLRYVSANK